eukprot:4698515-Prorocentrum_lima.AAC.1
MPPSQEAVAAAQAARQGGQTASGQERGGGHGFSRHERPAERWASLQEGRPGRRGKWEQEC